MHILKRLIKPIKYFYDYSTKKGFRNLSLSLPTLTLGRFPSKLIPRYYITEYIVLGPVPAKLTRTERKCPQRAGTDSSHWLNSRSSRVIGGRLLFVKLSLERRRCDRFLYI